jgi:hypothetical protein
VKPPGAKEMLARLSTMTRDTEMRTNYSRIGSPVRMDMKCWADSSGISV